MAHTAVLQKEVLEYLSPQPNENFVDCTLGDGGHTKLILEAAKPKGKVVAIDWDRDSIKRMDNSDRVILINDSFKNLKEIADRYKFNFSGILFDLGLSSRHFEDSGRGFSFQKNEPLDMRFNEDNPLTAEKIINYWSFQDIDKVLKEYGEEKFSESIARNIIDKRKSKQIQNTKQLVEIIEGSVAKSYQHKKIHCATKTFQALRMAVNEELKNIEEALPQALDVLAKGGRIVAISFHGLEDRIIKNYFKEKSKEGLLEILTKKPVTAKQEELKVNPRARSAKLRAARKI